MKNVKPETLNPDALYMTPINKDWSIECGEGWEYFEAAECEECGKALISHGGEAHNELFPDSDCPGYVPTCGGPMMNYYYECPGLDGTEAEKLVNLPLCLIQLNDGSEREDWGLALTGGGQDLSWEICEAYALLGFLPPLHFCDLPRMAGRGKSERDLAIINACRRSVVVAGWRHDRINTNLNAISEDK